MLFSKTVICETYSEREKKWGKGEKKQEAIHGEIGKGRAQNIIVRKGGREDWHAACPSEKCRR